MACCTKDEVLQDPCQAITDGVLTDKNYASFGISTGEWLIILTNCQILAKP